MAKSIQDLIRTGAYGRALKEARQRSIDLVKEGRTADAAQSLALAAHALCLMNFPSKARNLASEANELATRVKDLPASARALSIGALALLRLGDFDQAETWMDRALDAVHKAGESETPALARLVSAELALAQEDFTEARAYAEDAFALGAELSVPWIKARACLVKAITEERSGNLPGTLELLRRAEEELKRDGEAETHWLVQSAFAKTLAKTGRAKEAKERRERARSAIDQIAGGLEPRVRERYLRNPAVIAATGDEPNTASGVWRVPVQITAPAPVKTPSEPTLQSIRPVLDVIKKINTELNLRRLITMILETMISFCNARRGTIVVFDRNRFKVELSLNHEGKELKAVDMGVSRTVLKLVRDHGKRVVSGDAQRDPELKLIESIQDQSLLSVLCLPLRVKTRLIGAVYLDNPHVAGAFGDSQIEISEILTDHAAIAIDNALMHIKTIHDNLTHLFNHSHFEKRVEQEVARARRHAHPLGLLMIDLDDFKGINDRLGHDAGNETLRQIARALASATRGADVVARVKPRGPAPILARYGGDEFEILLPDTDKVGTLRAAERIIHAIGQAKIRYADMPVEVNLSIGAAVFPDHAPDARQLMLRADEALYEAKRSGKGRAILYTKP